MVMKIFFAGSIRGGRSMLHTYIRIIGLLKEQGHTVVSEHVASVGLEEIEAKISDEIFTVRIQMFQLCCQISKNRITNSGLLILS